MQLRELMLSAITSMKTLFGPPSEEINDAVGDPPSVLLWRKLVRLTGKAVEHFIVSCSIQRHRPFSFL